MVRFHWPVEGTQHCAWVPHGGMQLEEDKGVRHITVDMELAGQNETVMSLLTVPADYLDSHKVSPLGIVLGHGRDAEDSWRGALLEPLAAHFAAAGHVVVRYFCPLKEQRRHRLFEKAFDVAAASPYAAGVKRWAFVGFDNGARIAAGVGAKVAPRDVLAGFAFLSYPLLDPAPPPPKQKAGAAPPTDSVGPLTKLDEFRLPTFFLCGEFDRLCPGSRLKQVIEEVLPSCDCRVVVLEDLSGRFCPPGTKELADSTLSAVIQHVQTFITALKEELQRKEGDPAAAGGGLAACPLPKAADLVPSERPLPDVPESPKREASPEGEEEPEPESPPPPARGRGGRKPGAGATPAAPGSAAGVRPGLPPGMVAVMGPAGQPMLIPAAMAGNPQQLQMLALQQQMLAAHLKQQQAAAGGGAAAGTPGAAGTPAAAAAQQQMQLQMALAMQQMAAAAAARPGAAGAVPAAAGMVVPPSAAAAAVLLQQQQQQVQAQMGQAAQAQQEQQAVAMAVDVPPGRQ